MSDVPVERELLHQLRAHVLDGRQRRGVGRGLRLGREDRGPPDLEEQHAEGHQGEHHHHERRDDLAFLAPQDHAQNVTPESGVLVGPGSHLGPGTEAQLAPGTCRERTAAPIFPAGTRLTSWRAGRRMNPRQRRAVLLLALAGAGLIGVFALVANYVSEIETEVGDKVVGARAHPPGRGQQGDPRRRRAHDARSPSAGSRRPRCTDRDAARRLRRRLRPAAELDPAGGHARRAARDQRRRARGRDPRRRLHGRRRQDRAGRRRRRDRLLRGRERRPRDGRQGQAGALDRDRAGRARDRRRPAAAEGRQRRHRGPAGPGRGRAGHVRAQQAPGVIKVAHAQTFAADVRLALLRPGDDPVAHARARRSTAAPTPRRARTGCSERAAADRRRRRRDRAPRRRPGPRGRDGGRRHRRSRSTSCIARCGAWTSTSCCCTTHSAARPCSSWRATSRPPTPRSG